MTHPAEPSPGDAVPRKGDRTRARINLLILLLPIILLSMYTLVLPMIIFTAYSFRSFAGARISDTFSLDAYRDFFSDSYNYSVIGSSLQIAVVVTLITLVIAYPLAYCLWRLRRPSLQRWLALIIFSPVLVSVVVRSYGWSVVLADQGVLNTSLIGVGLIDSPIKVLFTSTAVVIGMIHVFLPFVVFPIYTSMLRMDPALREAAYDLGAGWTMYFVRVAFPRTLPGVLAGAQVCFALALGSFVTASLLGGGRIQLLPMEVYQATAEINWPTASVANMVLLVLAFVSMLAFNRLSRMAED